MSDGPFLFYLRREAGVRVLLQLRPRPDPSQGSASADGRALFSGAEIRGHFPQGEIRKAASPMVAARMGRSRRRPVRHDRDFARESFLLEAPRAKFSQHEELKKTLRYVPGPGLGRWGRRKRAEPPEGAPHARAGRIPGESRLI